MRLVILLVVAWCGVARAGVCLSDEEREADMRLVEAYAKDRSAGGRVDEAYGWLCVSGQPKLATRVRAACETILDRDGDKRDGGLHPCVIAAAASGVATLGKHDLFALIGTMTEDPIESDGGVGFTKTGLLGRMGDPRGANVIVDMWKAAIPRAEAREKHHGHMADWSSWRQLAALSLGMVGDADTAAFLREQSKATVDTHVRDACLDAATAIDKRSHR